MKTKLLRFRDGARLHSRLVRYARRHAPAYTTRCPEDPRRIPGASSLLLSSHDTRLVNACPVEGPLTAFLFDTTIADIEAMSDDLWRDEPAYDSWLHCRRYPGDALSTSLASFACVLIRACAARAARDRRRDEQRQAVTA